METVKVFIKHLFFIGCIASYATTDIAIFKYFAVGWYGITLLVRVGFLLSMHVATNEIIHEFMNNEDAHNTITSPDYIRSGHVASLMGIIASVMAHQTGDRLLATIVIVSFLSGVFARDREALIRSNL